MEILIGIFILEAAIGIAIAVSPKAMNTIAARLRARAHALDNARKEYRDTHALELMQRRREFGLARPANVRVIPTTI